MLIEHIKTIGTALGVAMTVGALIWGAATLAQKVDALDVSVQNLTTELQSARDDLQKAWAIACQGADVPMQRCF